MEESVRGDPTIMGDANHEGGKKKHRKLNSIHKRRGVEINNPAGYVDDFNFDPKKAVHNTEGHSREDMLEVSEIQDLFDPQQPEQVQLFPGDMIEVQDRPGVAMIHYVNGNVIGIELDGPTGKSDGVDNTGTRQMRVPPRCAAFIDRETVTRILPVAAPPRFTSYAHDIYPGDVVMVNRNVGVGIARYVSAHLVGVELNSDSGDSDGLHDGRRYFKVKAKHAMFSAPNLLKKIHPEDLLNKLNHTVEDLNKCKEKLNATPTSAFG